MHTDLPAVSIQPKSSRCLLLLLIVIHGAGVIAIPLTTIDLLYQGMAAAGVLLSMLHNLRRQFFAVARLRFVWRKDDTWTYTDLRGARRHVSYWKAVWVSPQLILIRLRPDQGRRWVTLVLCGDSVSAELHRELRVRLYLRGANSCPGSKW